MSENAEDVTYMPVEQFDELARTLDEWDAINVRSVVGTEDGQ